MTSATVLDGGSLQRVAVGRPAPQADGETPSRQWGRAFLAVPLVLVNLAAIWGQAGWAFENITKGGLTGVGVAILFAFAIESIGVYLAWESHESLMADQASALLRVGSYGIGILAGVLNFLHFSAQSNATGIAFGALSAISPWLWAVWSRARNRTRLAELGLMDVRGVRLSTARKLWHPIRSVKVMAWASWAGVTDPAEAVAGWEASAPEPAGKHASEPPTAPVTVVEALEPPQDRRERILALKAAQPDLTTAQIGEHVGVSGRRVRQVLAKEEAS